MAAILDRYTHINNILNAIICVYWLSTNGQHLVLRRFIQGLLLTFVFNEELFQSWERKIEATGKELNNPKIPMRLVRTASRVYPKQENTPSDPPTAL